MKSLLRTGIAVRLMVCFASSVTPFHIAFAQQVITPAPEPVTGQPPSAPDDAQESHDQIAILQLMKVVELSKLVAGGIGQLFDAAKSQKEALDIIRDAQVGPKAFPLFNSAEEVEGRGGGEGLNEMAEGAMNGALNAPKNLTEALAAFRQKFGLDNAFELRNDELPSKKMLAELAARGSIGGATAEDAYKRANASSDRLDQYIVALTASRDLKTSIDINTRVMIELTQQTNESVRTQSVIASMVGTYFMVLAGGASEKDWVDNLKDFNR